MEVKNVQTGEELLDAALDVLDEAIVAIRARAAAREIERLHCLAIRYVCEAELSVSRLTQTQREMARDILAVVLSNLSWLRATTGPRWDDGLNASAGCL